MEFLMSAGQDLKALLTTEVNDENVYCYCRKLQQTNFSD